MQGQMNYPANSVKKIKELVVSDYFTANIKAEVVLDTLLTPYIAQIVEMRLGRRAGELVFLTKEMSIPGKKKSNPEEDDFGSSGAKIDYVLTDRETVYLVELKTNNNIDNAQKKRYIECQGVRFGDKLGRQLLAILSKPKKTFSLKLKEPWGDGTLKEAFESIMQVPLEEMKGICAAKAKALIREKGWAQKKGYRSRKYLYTLGQLADYLEGERNRNGLWNKKMQIVYLTLDCGDIELAPGDGKTEKITIPGISLREAVQRLQPEPGDDELVWLLQAIAAEI